MRTAQIEKRIAESVATVRRFGFRLVAAGRWGTEYQRGAWVPTNGDREVCICGAIALAENPTTRAGILSAVARKLGITAAQAESLSDGFEGHEPMECGDTYDKVWYRIGRKWRRRADEVRA